MKFQAITSADTAALYASFIASGRQVTECPTRKVGPTRATIPNAMSAEGKRQRARYAETAAL
jgi:hypothetical protein